MRRHGFWLLYLTIVCLAVAIRLWGLGKIPAGLYWDEVAMLADAKKIVATGTDLHGLSPWHLIYPSYGDYKLAPYIWLATVSVRLFGVNNFALRLPSALAGLLTVIIAGQLARLLAGLSDHKSTYAQGWQLATMLVMAITPWSVLFSRTGFEGHLAQMLLALASLALLAATAHPDQSQTKKQRLIKIILLISSGICGGLASWTYYSVRFVWPVVVILIGLYSWRRLADWRHFVLSLTIVGTIFGLMLAIMAHDPLYAVSNQLRLGTPSLLNDADLPHVVNWQRQLTGNNLLSRLLFNQKLTQATQLLINVSHHLDWSYLFLTGDANLRHSLGTVGLFYLWSAPLLLAGLYQTWRHDWRLTALLVGWWLIGLVPASVPTTGVPHALRSLNSLVPSLLLISNGFTWWLQYIFSAKNKSFLGISYTYYLLGATALIGLLSTSYFFYYYVHIYPEISTKDWLTANQPLAATLQRRQADYDQVLVVNLDQFLYLWYMVEPDFAPTDWPASQGYRFPQLDNVAFDHYNWPDQGHLYLLGPVADIQNILADRSITTYQLVDDLTLGEDHYWGVSIDLPAGSAAQ